MQKIFSEFKNVTILSINPIDMEGKVASDAKSFKLPYTVLVGRDSDVIEKYKITKLPRLVIVKKDGVIAVTERFMKLDPLRAQVKLALK